MIRIGPSGWAYKDWEGIVYPAKKPKGFDRLSFLAQYFDDRSRYSRSTPLDSPTR
jgi:uncharacterized protein YecE (DUF72 family)